MSFDVFISYSSLDKAVADATCATLENAGIRCWIAPRDIRPGQDWDEALVQAIDRCRAMVLIFTQHSNESKQVGREVKRAFNRETPVIPMRIENALPGERLGFYLDGVHWLDAFAPPFEQHLKQLATIIKAILEAEANSPPSSTRAESFQKATLAEVSEPSGETPIPSNEGLERQGFLHSAKPRTNKTSNISINESTLKKYTGISLLVFGIVTSIVCILVAASSKYNGTPALLIFLIQIPSITMGLGILRGWQWPTALWGLCLCSAYIVVDIIFVFLLLSLIAHIPGLIYFRQLRKSQSKPA